MQMKIFEATKKVEEVKVRLFQYDWGIRLSAVDNNGNPVPNGTLLEMTNQVYGDIHTFLTGPIAGHLGLSLNSAGRLAVQYT